MIISKCKHEIGSAIKNEVEVIDHRLGDVALNGECGAFKPLSGNIVAVIKR